MPVYVLDTDICIDVLRGREPLRTRVRSSSPMDLTVTAMTEAELRYGARNSSDPARDQARVEAFLVGLADPQPFDREAARRYAEIRFALKAAPIGERDLVIASTVLAHRGRLVTRNRREFGRVPGLEVEDWIGMPS